jgi:hypothetical protein
MGYALQLLSGYFLSCVPRTGEEFAGKRIVADWISRMPQSIVDIHRLDFARNGSDFRAAADPAFPFLFFARSNLERHFIHYRGDLRQIPNDRLRSLLESHALEAR